MVGGFGDDAVLVLANRHGQVLELRYVLLHRVAEPKPAFLVEQHQGDAGDRLGHGVDAENGVLGHRLGGLHVLGAEGAEVRHLAVPGDERGDGRQAAVID